MALTIRKGDPPGVVIHHSLTKDGDTKDWESIRKYHMTAPEYMMSDIGYHWGIEKRDGLVVVVEGRPANTIGGHTKGYNDMIGICVVGNFDLAPPDAQHMEVLVGLCKGLMAVHGLTPDQFHRHSEFAKKSCPGTKFPWFEFIQSLKG